VGAGIAPLAVGSQTVGSVLRPAAFCGVVGFKPSYGRIPRDGIIPFSKSVDTVGTFSQDVAGTTLAAQALFDVWRPLPDGAPKTPVLGVPEGPYLEQAEPAGLEALERQISQLQERGYRVRRVRAMTDIRAINRRHLDLIAGDFFHAHRRWFLEWGALYRAGNADLFDVARRTTGVALAAAEPSPRWLRADLAAAMEAFDIDAWISPSATGVAPVGLRATGVTLLNLPWTHAGMPSISVPAGDVDGMPVGLQVVARFGEDERLLAWARGLEDALR
jgi:Asp-tRNA(Asn)/Glu-tRNA(Gln) amidotransferase A subunit family amidase